MRAGRPRRTAAAAGLTLLAALTAAGAAAVVVPSSPPQLRPAATAALPPPVRPAFVPGAPRPLRRTPNGTLWAAVRGRRPVAVHGAAGGGALLGRLSPRTPEGTRNLVVIVGRAEDARGRPWVHVRLPVLPNNTTGWVPRSALGGYHRVLTRLDVDLGRLRATLLRDGRRVLDVPVAVGMPGWPTPRGRFYVRNRLTRYRSPTYGPVAFGTSARSEVATDWPAGGFVGIHGTNRPDLVPGRISHGCIRMRNADILALARRMPIGTPVVVR